MTTRVPIRQIRAVYDVDTIRIYQAFSDAIADAALAAHTLVPPFRLDRMTWIKPSFTWMMYRSGWATKQGQQRIFALDITRKGFEWALAHSCLSQFDPNFYDSYEAWQYAKRKCNVRIQWDPERSPRMARLTHSTIQIGISGVAVVRYTQEWIQQLTDVTGYAVDMRQRMASERTEQWLQDLPNELPYPLPLDLQHTIGIAADA